jgi:hypothetical protein
VSYVLCSPLTKREAMSRANLVKREAMSRAEGDAEGIPAFYGFYGSPLYR